MDIRSVIFAKSLNMCQKHYQPDICITKTCSYNVYPFEPHFYIEKVGYAWVYLFFLFLLQNKDFGYSLEPPRVPTIYFLSKNKKNIKIFSYEHFQFLQLKNLCILHGYVFVMSWFSQYKVQSEPIVRYMYM